MNPFQEQTEPQDALARELALEMYVQMRRMRMLEERVTALSREGRIVGRVYTGRGQEAIPVGSALALERADVVAPLYRDLGVHLVRGVSPREIICQYMGRADSFTRGKDSGLHIGDPARGLISMISNLSTSLPVAVGAALAFQIRREPRVALTLFGDGSTSTGSAHEGLNFAAALRLPVVFLCENNQWALSTPNVRQFALEQLVDRAQGYGMPGVRIDGNDVIAVYRATGRALAWARSGKGPTFIEAVTMRMDGHSTTDPAAYVPREMLQEWSKRDPIDRFGRWLHDRHWLDDEADSEITARLGDESDEAVAFAEARPLLPPAETLADVYAPESEHV